MDLRSSSNLFGLPKDSTADEMLFVDIPDSIIADLPINQANPQVSHSVIFRCTYSNVLIYWIIGSAFIILIHQWFGRKCCFAVSFSYSQNFHSVDIHAVTVSHLAIFITFVASKLLLNHTTTIPSPDRIRVLSRLFQVVTKRPSNYRGKRYLCRTCGEGFSTISRRDKHTLSNACTRVTVEKKYQCCVCSRRFQSKRTHLTHESWCLYKKKRKEKLADGGNACSRSFLFLNRCSHAARN